MKRTLFLVAALGSWGEALATGETTFYQHVLPILKRSCVGCHAGESPKGDLRLETLEGLLEGGKSGTPVSAGKPAESLLYLLASREKKPNMPPKKEEALPAEEVEVLRRWIESGAKPGEKPAEDAPYSKPLTPPVYPRAPVITALAYSTDGRRIYAAAYHEIVALEAEPADPGHEAPIQRLVGEAEKLCALAVSPDGKLLAAAGGSPALFGELQLWSTDTGKLERFKRIGRDTLFSVSFSPDGKRVAVGGTDRTIHVIETESGKEVLASEIHSDWIFSLAYSVDGSRIVSGGRDKTLKVCDAADGKLVSTLASFGEPVLSVQPRGTTAFVACVADGKTPALYDAKELKEVRKYEGMPGNVLAMAFSLDGKLLAAGGASEEVRVYQTDDGARKVTLRGNKEWIYAVAFRPDGERIATAGYEGTVRIYGLADDKERRSFVPVPLAPPGAPAGAGGSGAR